MEKWIGINDQGLAAASRDLRNSTLLTALPLPVATKTALSGLLLFGLPQLFTDFAIAIVGKSGFHYLMEQVFGAAKKLRRRCT